MDETKLLAVINLRISERVKKEFIDKARRYGQPMNILRDLIDAFIEGRLVVKPREF